MTEKTVFDFADVLVEALADGGDTHTLGDIHDAITRHDMQLWYRNDSAMVTQIEVTPRKKVLRIALAGGTLPDLEAMLPAVFAWARDTQRCDVAMLDGRRGWSRLPQATSYGWTVRGVTMLCPLTGAPS